MVAAMEATGRWTRWSRDLRAGRETMASMAAPLPVPLAALGVLAAIALALVAATHPLAALGLALLLLLAVAATARPALSVAVAIATMALAPEYYESLAAHGSAITRAHRLLVLASLTPLLASRGLRSRLVPAPVIAYGLLLVLTYTVVDRQDGLTPTKSAFALATLTVGWLASQLRWRRPEARAVLLLLTALPVLSVGTGMLLAAAGVHPLHMAEYTGVDRLQGATIPAYLGFLAVAGSAAGTALLLLRRAAGGARRRDVPWVSVGILASIVIAGLSGTRGALIASVVVASPVPLRMVRRARRGSRLVRICALAVAATIGVIGITPMLVERTKTDERTGALDTSGRAEAWSFYLDQTSDDRELGRGLGAGPVIGEAGYGVLRGDFRGTHNEYVRLYVEGGWVGSALVIGAIALHLRHHLARTPSDVRAGAAALVVAFAAYSIVDNTVSTFQFFLPFGLLVGIYSARAGA